MDPTTGPGEVRVVIKELKKHSAACGTYNYSFPMKTKPPCLVACRKRKARCSGTSPCLHCTAKGIECIFTEQKKRGPQAKKQKPNSTKVIQYTNISNSAFNLSPTAPVNVASMEHQPYSQTHTTDVAPHSATMYSTTPSISNMLGPSISPSISPNRSPSPPNDIYHPSTNAAFYNTHRHVIPNHSSSAVVSYNDGYQNTQITILRKEHGLFEDACHTLIIDKYFDTFGAGMPFITNYARVVRPVTASEGLYLPLCFPITHLTQQCNKEPC